MNASDGVAPAVKSILASARSREVPGGSPISVDARSIHDAISRTEAAGQVPVIAEVKPTSPTSDHRREEDPVSLAQEMVAGGASAISVLTEPDHFGGSPAALREIRDSVSVPILRKDFILREEQFDVVAADIVLVIARFVDDVPALVTAAQERGFQVLVETHTSEEMQTALEAAPALIGINNRDLETLSVDLETFERVAPAAPASATLVAESGIRTGEDVRRMRSAGADALLIGSAIMEGDVTATTRSFVEATQ